MSKQAARKPMRKAIFQVTFTLEVDDGDEGESSEIIVEEAVTTLLDEELSGHSDGGTRCGVRFCDAMGVQAKLVVRRP